MAIVHDWLETYAGAERVLEQLLILYPDADLFSLVDFVPEGKRDFLRGKTPKVSFIQYLPFARKHFRLYVVLFFFAMRFLNLKPYDVVLSSSHCMAKNVRIRPGQVHICYCHSPVRYAWDMRDEYLAQVGLGGGLKGVLVRLVMGFIRLCDLWGTRGVTHFIANSRFIAQRIKDCYGREADVVCPPVAVQDFAFCAEKSDFYMTASRMVPYKKIDVIVRAFARMPDKKLVVIGAGPEMERVRMAAEGAANIRLMGYQPFDVLKKTMQQARAFVFAAKEDFGITPVEALACGTPVIAYGQGGVLDSVTPETGLFFDAQTPEAVMAAILDFEARGGEEDALYKACRARAEAFGEGAFRERMAAIVARMEA